MPQYLVTLSYSLHFCCNLHPTPESNLGFLKKNFCIDLLCVGLHICHNMLVELTGQLGGSQCSLITCELQKSNFGHQIWKKTLLLAGQSCPPLHNSFLCRNCLCDWILWISTNDWIFSFFLGSIFSLNDFYFICLWGLYHIDFIIN